MLLVFSTFLLLGCQQNSNRSYPVTMDVNINAKVHEPFKLRAGQTAKVEEKDLSITLSDVYIYGVICTKDGKCPPPDATANLKIQKGTGTIESLQISTYDHHLNGEQETYEDQMKNGTPVTFGEKPNGKPIIYNNMMISLSNVEISKPDNVDKNIDTYRTPDNYYVFTFELK